MGFELNEDDRNQIKMADMLVGMVNTPGWKAFEQLVSHHIEQKVKDVLVVTKSIDQAMEQNAGKGAVLMGKLIMGLPRTIIEDAVRLRERLGENDE